MRTDVEALTGGALRARHTLTNTTGAPYLLDGLEVTFPLPAATADILDFTGRHEGERAPQRHQVADGTWLRESRRGKPGLDGASVLAAGTAGFGFDHGEVLTTSVAGSSNSVIAVQRSGSRGRHRQRRGAAAARRAGAARGRFLHDPVGGGGGVRCRARPRGVRPAPAGSAASTPTRPNSP